jgi:hypothetical protein
MESYAWGVLQSGAASQSVLEVLNRSSVY